MLSIAILIPTNGEGIGGRKLKIRVLRGNFRMFLGWTLDIEVEIGMARLVYAVWARWARKNCEKSGWKWVLLCENVRRIALFVQKCVKKCGFYTLLD